MKYKLCIKLPTTFIHSINRATEPKAKSRELKQMTKIQLTVKRNQLGTLFHIFFPPW